LRKYRRIEGPGPGEERRRCGGTGNRYPVQHRKFRRDGDHKYRPPLPVPKDTFASILTSGLIGEQYIGLAAGGDEVMLKDGDKLMKTNSALVLEEMIGQFLFSKASEASG